MNTASSVFDLHWLLTQSGLDRNRRIKMYRHSNHERAKERYGRDTEEILEAGDLEIFQSVQSSKILGDDIVAFFMGEKGRLSRFVGIWKVDSIHNYKHVSPKANRARNLGFLRNGDVWHELSWDPQFLPFENRLIIEWPETGRHHQWLYDGQSVKQIAVHEIRSIGISRSFPGFTNVVLTFAELTSLVQNDTSGWRDALEKTRGAYLITDIESGDLYVGSATGADGIWGRWSQYANSVHGGNRVMIDKTENVERFSSRLQFSILETMGNLATRADGIAIEKLWKRKLGRKATVLNAN
ncbi:MAG: GIY-YIG nuclease family protein [Nitratireductor sp.]|nr:GIY-YIG nuclease family protein [Nitratireductor sp.]